MVSIARSSLIYEWRRYMAAVLATTFAGLLVIIQLALLLGMFSTVSVVIDKSSADLWIGYRNTESVDLGRPISPMSDASAWIHPGVQKIERYGSGFGDLRRRDGVPISVFINAIDASPDALAFSELLSPEQRALLREPDAMLVDVADLSKLNAVVGTVVEINGKRARIAGAVEGLRAIGGVNVITSFATARSLDPMIANQVTYYLVHLHPDYDPEKVSQDISDKSAFPHYSVWTADSFSVRSQLYWLLESGSGIGTGFASLLAMVVGIVITSQTLSAAILASLKEFAALRALGVSIRSLRSVVIEQSLWVGFIGLTVTAFLTAAIAWIGSMMRVAMSFPLWMLTSVACVIVTISVLSGLLALRPLLRAEPAELLR